MRPEDASDHAATVVALRTWERVLIWGGFPLLGAGIGWLLKWAADWVVSLPWAPFQGPFELVASIPDLYATIGGLALGIAAGLLIACIAEGETLITAVGDDRVAFKRDGSGQDVPRASVSAVFFDGKHLVLLDTTGAELAREQSDLGAERYRAAFEAHGYPWRDGGDPFANEYRRWVEGDPDLSAGAHALFKARARALEKSEEVDARQLRAELARLGIVLREVEGRQFWRSAGSPPAPHGDG